MGPTDIAYPASSISMTDPFSESLIVHVPKLTAPTVEDLLEDQVAARPVQFSHIDLIWTSEAHRNLFD